MKVKKNNILIYGLVSLLIFTLGIGLVSASEYENYFGIMMNNQEYNNLLGLGFTEEEIYYMDEQTFNDNKDLSATVVAKTDKYYKTVYTDLDGETYSVEVTKEEYDNQGSIMQRGHVETEYKYVSAIISQNGSKYRYKTSMSWKLMPSTRSYDIIAATFEDDVYINSSVYFNYSYCNSSGDCTTATDYYNKKSTSTGGSAVFKFPTSARSLSAALYYDVSKNTSNTITRLEICGDYSHATESVSSSDISNYTMTLDGIALGTNIYDSYDSIPCATSIWAGSW